MHNNKVILKNCPNFNKIVNADFLEDDPLSLQLVKIYKDFIFNIDIHSNADLLKVRDIDMSLGKYVDDYFFRKTFREEIVRVKVKKTTENIIHVIVDSIIEIFKKYELESTRKIYVSRWI